MNIHRHIWIIEKTPIKAKNPFRRNSKGMPYAYWSYLIISIAKQSIKAAGTERKSALG
jgi:hypothetical protein